MDNKAIAGVLYETADMLEIDGQDSFRIRSYRNAAQAIENHPQPIHRRQVDSRLLRILADEFVRNGSEQAGTITASSIRIHPAPVRQTDQGLQRTLHDLARGPASDSGDQADTAGIVVGGDVTWIHLYIVYRQSRTEVQSRISMTLMDFSGGWMLTEEGLNHEGHEGTRRKTLGLAANSFVILGVLRGSRFWLSSRHRPQKS